MVCFFALTVSISVNAYAGQVLTRQAPAGVAQPTLQEIRTSYAFDGFDLKGINFLDQQLITAANVRWVRTTQLGDQAWRNRYPTSWMWEAQRTVTRAGEFLNNNFAISLYAGNQRYWNHNLANGSTSTTVLNNARNQGLGDATLMVAFTGLSVRDGGQNIMGAAFVGQPFSFVACFGFDENAMTARHEIGHMYGLNHCSSTTCFMAAAARIGSFNQICATHRTQFQNNRLRY